VYTSSVIYLHFNVTRPLLNRCETVIIFVNYTLDGNTAQLYTIWPNTSGGRGFGTGSGIHEYSTSFALPSLEPGTHTLTVTAEGVVWTGGQQGLEIFFIDGSSAVSFANTIETHSLKQIATPSPTSTQIPTPSAIPTTSSADATPAVPEFPSILAFTFLVTASLLGTMMFKKQFFKVQTVK